MMLLYIWHFGFCDRGLTVELCFNSAQFPTCGKDTEDGDDDDDEIN